MKRNRIRLNENILRKLIREAIEEVYNNDFGRNDNDLFIHEEYKGFRIKIYKKPEGIWHIDIKDPEGYPVELPESLNDFDVDEYKEDMVVGLAHYYINYINGGMSSDGLPDIESAEDEDRNDMMESKKRGYNIDKAYHGELGNRSQYYPNKGGDDAWDNSKRPGGNAMSALGAYGSDKLGKDKMYKSAKKGTNACKCKGGKCKCNESKIDRIISRIINEDLNVLGKIPNFDSNQGYVMNDDNSFTTSKDYYDKQRRDFEDRRRKRELEKRNKAREEEEWNKRAMPYKHILDELGKCYKDIESAIYKDSDEGLYVAENEEKLQDFIDHISYLKFDISFSLAGRNVSFCGEPLMNHATRTYKETLNIIQELGEALNTQKVTELVNSAYEAIKEIQNNIQ